MAGSQGMMRSKFGASEMRLNMLDTFVPLEYPVTVYRDVWDARQVRVVKILKMVETDLHNHRRRSMTRLLTWSSQANGQRLCTTLR